MQLSTGKHGLLPGLALLASLVQASDEPEYTRLAAFADTDFVLEKISVVEEMVVTGTRTRQSQQQSPVKVDVVTQESISRRHASDAAEAVEMVSGINIRDIHGKDGSEAWIQGISANRVLVMVDGEPVSASTGSSVDLTQLSVSDIRQVEIVKGATSALYGSAAMGGAINLITARPGPGLHGTLSADVGSFGSQNPDGEAASLSQQRVQARSSYGGDRFSLAAGVTARYADGFQVDPDAWSQQGPDGHKINAFATATLLPTEASEYSVRLEQYDQKQHNRITALLPPPNHRKHKQDDAQREQLSLRGSWEMSANRISAHGYDENYRNMSSPDGSFERHAEFATQKAGVQWDNDTLESQTWTMGAEFFAETLDQQKILADGTVSNEVDGCGEISRDRMEVYVQDDVRLGNLSLVPGLRMQNDSDFGTQLTPKINLRHDFLQGGEELLYLRAGVGSGYRVPNLKERCYVFDHSHLGYMIIGNENLQPEQSNSYQLGIAYQPQKTIQLEANLFRNNLKDLVEIVYSHHEGPVSVSQYQNVDSAYTQGLEFDMAYKFLADWKLGTAYALLRAIDEKTGERLKDRPEHQIKLQLDYHNDHGTGVTLLGSWQSDEHNAAQADDSPAWHKIDLKLNQSLHAYWSVYGGINNITDTQRKFDGSYDNRPVEGRLIYAGFRFDY